MSVEDAEDRVIDLRDLISELQQRGDDSADARSTTPNSQFLANLLTGLQRTNRARPAETKAAGAARIRRIATEGGLRVTIVDERTGVEIPAAAAERGEQHADLRQMLSAAAPKAADAPKPKVAAVPERGDLRQVLAPAAAVPERGDLRQMLAPAAAVVPERGDLRRMLAPAAASRAPETASARLLGAALNATKPRGGKRAAEGVSASATTKNHGPSASKRAR